MQQARQRRAERVRRASARRSPSNAASAHLSMDTFTGQRRASSPLLSSRRRRARPTSRIGLRFTSALSSPSRCAPSGSRPTSPTSPSVCSARSTPPAIRADYQRKGDANLRRAARALGAALADGAPRRIRRPRSAGGAAARRRRRHRRSPRSGGWSAGRHPLTPKMAVKSETAARPSGCRAPDSAAGQAAPQPPLSRGRRCARARARSSTDGRTRRRDGRADARLVPDVFEQHHRLSLKNSHVGSCGTRRRPAGAAAQSEPSLLTLVGLRGWKPEPSAHNWAILSSDCGVSPTPVPVGRSGSCSRAARRSRRPSRSARRCSSPSSPSVRFDSKPPGRRGSRAAGPRAPSRPTSRPRGSPGSPSRPRARRSSRTRLGTPARRPPRAGCAHDVDVPVTGCVGLGWSLSRALAHAHARSRAAWSSGARAVSSEPGVT